jgi:preprotein translocase SecF subunit
MGVLPGKMASYTKKNSLSLTGPAYIIYLHDVLVMAAIFSIFKIEINSPFIAAVLTIIGYSINNTIVLFDRIRENLKFKRQRDVVTLVNDSINETLTRTIYTSLTTMFVLLSLFFAFNFFVGGIDLKAFSLALLIGVVGGVYSTIFIAGALWISWRKKGALE